MEELLKEMTVVKSRLTMMNNMFREVCLNSNENSGGNVDVVTINRFYGSQEAGC